MKTETLLPLGKLDPGLREPDTPLDITTIADAAAQVEELGYDALVVEETKDDPYQLLALASTTTSTLGLGTSVAMAFPRSPTITAMSAWTLQSMLEWTSGWTLALLLPWMLPLSWPCWLLLSLPWTLAFLRSKISWARSSME